MDLTKENLAKTFQSRLFKKITIALGLAFFILTAFITYSPEPFLRFGYPGIFVFNLFGPGMILFVRIVPFFNLVILSFLTALGNTLNDSVAWIVGANSDVFVGEPKKLKRFEPHIKKYGSIALFTWAFLPTPYDIIGLVAGYLNVSYKRFVVPTFLGKFIRFLLLGIGILYFLDNM